MKRYKVAASVGGLALLAAACGSTNKQGTAVSTSTPASSTAGGSPYVVGVSTDLTGPAAAFGAQEASMAQAMFAKINSSGGIHGHKVEVIVKDNQNNPNQAILDAKAFVAAHANVMMFGPTATTMTAIQPFGAHTLIVDFGSGYTPPVPSNIFSISPYDSSPLGATLRFLKQKGLSRVGLLSSNDAAGSIAQQEVESVLKGSYGQSLGMKLAGAVAFDPTNPDITPELANVLGSKPQALISWVSGLPANVVAKAFTQESTSNIPLIVSWANGSLKFAQSTASFNPKELFAPVFKAILWNKLPSTDPYAVMGKNANALIESSAHQPLDEGGVLAYDPVNMVVRALTEGGTNLSAEVNALEHVVNYQGMEGVYNITSTDHKGEKSLQNNSLVIAQVENGTYVVPPGAS